MPGPAAPAFGRAAVPARGAVPWDWPCAAAKTGHKARRKASGAARRHPGAATPARDAGMQLLSVRKTLFVSPAPWMQAFSPPAASRTTPR
jgi:hypothetical protein